MTATDKLHRELDKRGIKWFMNQNGVTIYTSPVLGRVSVWENWYGGFVLDAGRVSMTLEQLIAATLRRGTCHDVWDIELTGRLRFQCSECGAVSLEITPNFCPVCGRKVVES